MSISTGSSLTAPGLGIPVSPKDGTLAGPNIDLLREVAGVVAAPIGFISDHMEVAYDLDTQASESAAEAGFDYERAATAGVHPDFVATLADLLIEQAAVARGERALPDHPCLTESVRCCLPHPQKEQTHVPSASSAH